MISPDELELVDKASDGFYIPSKPDILQKIEKILQAEEPDLIALADLVATDIGVSSVVLKTINAPFYGMRRTICEIKQAVLLLGMEVIKALVVGVILRRAYEGDSCISLERFWDSTNEIANSMVYVGGRIKDKVSIDKLYTVGLFHNCAIPAFAIKYPDYKEMLAFQDEAENADVTELENKQYGTNHAVMGYYIASSWGLPKEICKIILNHHRSDFLESNIDEESRLIWATLKVSENLVHRIRRFKDISDWPIVGQHCMDILHIDKEEFDDLEEDLSEML